MAETLADNSENPTTFPDNTSTIPDAPAENAPQERPRTSRGRPKGSNDSKPRIRRVPVVIEQEEAPAKRVEFKEPEPEAVQEPQPHQSSHLTASTTLALQRSCGWHAARSHGEDACDERASSLLLQLHQLCTQGPHGYALFFVVCLALCVRRKPIFFPPQHCPAKRKVCSFLVNLI